MKNIHTEKLGENFRVVRFDQAGASANVFNLETLAELDEEIKALAKDHTAKGVIFISAKDRVFHAGADLYRLAELSEPDLARFLELGQHVFGRVAALPMPTVAAIHGACLGGGCELSLACTYRVASPDRVTKIGLPETKLGILPAWGGSTRLPRLIGVTRALEIILAGKTPTARQALKYGLIDAIAPREHLLTAARKLVAQPPPRSFWWRHPLVNGLMATVISPKVHAQVQRETRGHYPAVKKAADVVLAAVRTSEAKSLANERKAVAELIKTDAFRNLLRLFFLREQARKSDGGKTEPFQSAAVIGAGVMGSGIAQWLSARGLRVILRDVNPQALAAGLDRIRKLFGNKRVFDKKEARDGMDRLFPSTAEMPLGRVDLVIEAAVEKMAAKKQIFAKLDEQAVFPETILATNTSALSLAEIASATKNPGRVVGLHFFNPTHKMELVEVVVAKQTSPETERRAVQFARQIGKLPVVVQDSPGFLVNRVLVPYLLEAGSLFARGARVEDLDEAMLDFGMPMGPLRLIDEVGVDIAEDVGATLAAALGDRLRLPPILNQMLKEKWLGRKTGRGFYLYVHDRKTKPNPGLLPFLQKDSAADLSRRQLQERLTLLIVNEAVRCLEEKIVATPDLIDFAFVMGTGFAPFRGGPLKYAETVGWSAIAQKMDQLTVEAGPHFTPCALLKKLALEGK